MKCIKLCIFVFIIAELCFVVSQSKVTADKKSPREEILGQLNLKMEEMIVLFEGLIPLAIEPVKKELTNKMVTSMEDMKKEFTRSLADQIKKEILNNITSENKNIVRELNELKQFKVKTEIENNNTATDLAKMKELNTKTNIKSENNKNKLVQYKRVIDDLERFKVQSDRTNSNTATELAQIKDSNIKTSEKSENNRNELVKLKTVIDGLTKSKEQSDITNKVGNIVREQFDNFISHKSAGNLTPFHAKNCAEHFNNGDKQSGIRTVYPSPGKEISVVCDQDTDGGRWTVFQTRDDIPMRENFYRTWPDYSKGFGNLSREFWLGLDNIHLMTKNIAMELRVDLEDAGGVKKFAKFKKFSIENAENKYRLNIGVYSGTAGNSLGDDNQMNFATFDRDSNYHCAAQGKGAWWYDDYCSYANLNGYQFVGKYANELPSLRSHGINWKHFNDEWNYSMKKTKMMIRPQ